MSTCIKCNEAFDGGGKLAQRLREVAAAKGRPKPAGWEPKVCSLCVWAMIEAICEDCGGEGCEACEESAKAPRDMDWHLEADEMDP